jgi:hypothetical protein
MAKPTDDIEWGTDGAAAILEPSGAKKKVGWLNAFRAPARWMNWMMRAYWRWTVWLTSLGEDARSAALIAGLQQRNSPFTASLREVRAAAYGAGLVVAVGTNGTAAYSSDGIGWTSVSLGAGISTDTVTDIIFANGKFVAVTAQAAGADNVSTSTDGINWTTQVTPSTEQLHSVAYGAGVYVAAGNSGTIYSSPDGATWTSRTSGFGVTAVEKVVYVNGLFIACGDAGKLSTSPDGITWTFQTSTFGAEEVLSAFYGNGLYVIVGNAGKLATSPDGTTWTAQTSGFGLDSILKGLYSSTMGLHVIVGDAGKIATSTNGTAWTLQTSGFGSSALTDIIEMEKRLVVVGEGGKLADSLNGTRWRLKLSAATAGLIKFARYFSETDTGNNDPILLAGSIDGVILSARGPVTTSTIITSRTNDAAAVGGLGECIESVVSAVGSFSSPTTKNVTSISLSAGDWDVDGLVALAAGAITGTLFEISLTTTTAGSGTLGDTRSQTSIMPTAAAGSSLAVPPKRFSFATTTTVYLTCGITFSAGTPSAYGRISARRVR